MEQSIRQIANLIQKAIAGIIDALQFAWIWSFGQIFNVFRSDWQSLPAWKMAVLAIVMIAIVVLLYVAAKRMWSALISVFQSLLAALTAFVYVLPYIVGAGAVAFIGGYVIKSVTL